MSTEALLEAVNLDWVTVEGSTIYVKPGVFISPEDFFGLMGALKDQAPSEGDHFFISFGRSYRLGAARVGLFDEVKMISLPDGPGSSFYTDTALTEEALRSLVLAYALNKAEDMREAALCAASESEDPETCEKAAARFDLLDSIIKSTTL